VQNISIGHGLSAKKLDGIIEILAMVDILATE